MNREIIEQAINLAQNNIIITDVEGNILWVNDSTLRNTGYTKKEMIGKNPRMFKSEKNNQKIFDELWDTIKNQKKQWKGKLVNLKKNKEEYVEMLSVTPIIKNKQLIGFIGVQCDITKEEEYKNKFKNKIEEVQKELKKFKNKQ